MDDQKMEIIKQLMEELQDMMQPSSDDLGDRLGRPKVEMKVESMKPMDGDDVAMDGDMDDPDEDFKQRLMKMRG